MVCRAGWLALVAVLSVVAAGVVAITVFRSQPVQAIGADDPAVQAAEDERCASDADVQEVTLTAAPATVRIGDLNVDTWAFNGQVPGPDPGTFFYHSHTGVQLDRGLYGPLIVDDPAEDLTYDREITVMLDDWLDGIEGTPDDVLALLRAEGMRHGGMDGMEHGSMGGTDESPLGDDTGDVEYLLFLSNGRPPGSPEEIAVEPGEWVRLRLINAASDTAFRVALGGAELTVTHIDGRPVVPTNTDAVLLEWVSGTTRWSPWPTPACTRWSPARRGRTARRWRCCVAVREVRRQRKCSPTSSPAGCSRSMSSRPLPQ